jgi:FXSXX-COOH protein
MAVADGSAPTEDGRGAGRGADEDPASEVESVVLDLTALSAEDIAALPDSVLGVLLRRVHDSCAEGEPFVAGYSEGA